MAKQEVVGDGGLSEVEGGGSTTHLWWCSNELVERQAGIHVVGGDLAKKLCGDSDRGGRY